MSFLATSIALAIACRCSCLLAAPVREEVILSDFSAHAVSNAWRTLDYETLDGIKGKLLYSPWGFKKRVKAEIPLPVKGKYRISLGLAGTRYALTEAPFSVMVRLKRDPAPVLMDAQAPVKEAGWWFQPVENEWKTAELDGDTLVAESPRNSRSLLAWIRLVPIDVLPDCSHPVHEMIVTDDAYHYCASEDDGLDEVLAPIMRYANSPVKKLFFCVAHGDSVYAVPTAVGQSHEGLSDDDVESLHARDCNRVYRRLRRRHPDLLSRLADFTHSQGMEFHVSFRTGCTLDITHLTHPASAADPGREAVGVSRAENYCCLWDGTPVARYSYAKREVQDHFLSLYREMLIDKVDGLNLVWIRGLPAMLFEPAFRERFRAAFGEELGSEDDPRVETLRAEIMTDYHRRVRALLGKRRLSVFVPATSAICRKYGLDIARLAHEGIVDEILPSDSLQTAAHDEAFGNIEFAYFREACAGTKATFRPFLWGLSADRCAKAFAEGAAGVVHWDGTTHSWREVELMHRLTDADGSAACRWENENPASSRVHPFKTFMGFDAARFPWHMAY